MAAGEGGSFEARWEGSEFSVVVESIEETASSHGGDVTGVEAAGREARQGASSVEGSEEAASYRREIARVEAAGRKAGEGTILVEGFEEGASY